jgi:hypothetical protein
MSQIKPNDTRASYLCTWPKPPPKKRNRIHTIRALPQLLLSLTMLMKGVAGCRSKFSLEQRCWAGCKP